MCILSLYHDQALFYLKGGSVHIPYQAKKYKYWKVVDVTTVIFRYNFTYVGI